MPHQVHRTVEKQVTLSIQKEGSGFLVRKVLGGVIDICDPFILLDHIGPVTYRPGEAVGALDHPHRGFETVTYVIEGGVKHQDSAGNKGELRSGWVQWMTAGRGVLHSEMPTEELLKQGGTWEGFQLWVNLPSKDKMIEPEYQDLPPEAIPTIRDTEEKSVIKVIAGHCRGTRSPVRTRIPILLLDVHLSADGSFAHEIPADYSAFVYVWKGSGKLGHEQRPAPTGTVALLSHTGSCFTVRADSEQGCHVLIGAGEPLREPVVRYGPFVMNTEEEIQQAIEDYRNGKLGSLTPELGGVKTPGLSPLTPEDDSCTLHGAALNDGKEDETKEEGDAA